MQVDTYNDQQRDFMARLEPISALLGGGLPKAIAEAKDYFGNTKEYEPVTFSVIVRNETRMMLKAQKFVEIRDCIIPLAEPDYVPNVGLQLLHAEIEVKILKTVDGRLPSAKTDSRASFYTQELPLGTYTKPVGGRVVYLWQVDDVRHELEGLWLVCPRFAARGKRMVAEYWRVPIAFAAPYVKPRKLEVSRDDLAIGIPIGEVQNGSNE